MTDHSYFESLYLEIFTALSQQTEDFCLLPMYCRLGDFFRLLKILRSATHRSTENWVLHGFGRHVVQPVTMPNLGMADREFELWTASDMGSSEMVFGLETGPVTGLAELAYYPSLGLDQTGFDKQSSNLRLYLTWVWQTLNSV